MCYVINNDRLDVTVFNLFPILKVMNDNFWAQRRLRRGKVRNKLKPNYYKRVYVRF